MNVRLRDYCRLCGRYLPVASLPRHACKPLEFIGADYRPHGNFGLLGAQDKGQLDRIEQKLENLFEILKMIPIEGKK